MNVIEIDAASNNGVDNIRQIREEVAYHPTTGKYKVYIIDEVHMLSPGAFNALLKTLEEPPSYVIFILATTEAHKIPITILSRCQRYDFHRISIDTIADRLAELMREEQVDVEERALRYVAKAGDGSMRDALSLLDQCIAFHLGETLTYDNVLEVLGAVDTEVFSRMLRQVLEKDITGAIGTLDELVNEGRDLGQMVTDFTWYLRNLLLLQSSDGMEDVLDISSDNLAALKEEAQMVSTEVLFRYIRIFSELGNQIRYATQKRILIEIAIIKLCRPETEKNYESLVDRIEGIEYQLKKGVVVQASSPQDGATPGGVQGDGEAQKSPELPQAIPEDIQKVIQNWKSILAEIGGSAKVYLNMAVPTLGKNGELVLMLDDKLAYDYLQGNYADCLDNLKAVIAEKTGKQVEVTISKNESGRRAQDVVPDLRKLINFDIEEENFDDE
jgi:DNA polymerase-3 subunit gamma/tau